MRPPPASPPRAPDYGDEAEEKTAAFDLADLERALKAKQPAVPEPDSERTVALSLDGLPLEGPVPQRPPPRQVQRTLVGTPVAPKAVVAQVAPRPARPASQVREPAPASSPNDEATQAVDMRAMIASIDAEHGAVAASDAKAPQARAIPPSPATLPSPATQASPPRRSAAPESAQPGIPERVVMPLPSREALMGAAPRPAAPAQPPQLAKAAPPARPASPANEDDFIGAIAFFVRHTALEDAVRQGERPASDLDAARATRGLRNAGLIAGAVLALTLVAGVIA